MELCLEKKKVQRVELCPVCDRKATSFSDYRDFQDHKLECTDERPFRVRVLIASFVCRSAR